MIHNNAPHPLYDSIFSESCLYRSRVIVFTLSIGDQQYDPKIFLVDRGIIRLKLITRRQAEKQRTRSTILGNEVGTIYYVYSVTLNK